MSYTNYKDFWFVTFCFPWFAPLPTLCELLLATEESWSAGWSDSIPTDDWKYSFNVFY